MHRTPDKLAENFHFDIESKDYFNGMLRHSLDTLEGEHEFLIFLEPSFPLKGPLSLSL